MIKKTALVVIADGSEEIEAGNSFLSLFRILTFIAPSHAF